MRVDETVETVLVVPVVVVVCVEGRVTFNVFVLDVDVGIAAVVSTQ